MEKRKIRSPRKEIKLYLEGKYCVVMITNQLQKIKKTRDKAAQERRSSHMQKNKCDEVRLKMERQKTVYKIKIR